MFSWGGWAGFILVAFSSENKTKNEKLFSLSFSLFSFPPLSFPFRAPGKRQEDMGDKSLGVLFWGKACFVLFPSFAILDLYLSLYLGPTFFRFISSFFYFLSPHSPRRARFESYRGSMAFQKLGHIIPARMHMIFMTAVMAITNTGMIQIGGGKKGTVL